MGAQSYRRAIAALLAMVSLMFLCQEAFASTAIQPFLCAAGADGSVVRWVNVQGHKAIGITIQQRNDQGGGKYVGLGSVAGNSTASAVIIPTATSSNVKVQLAVLTSTSAMYVFNPTSTSSNNYTWNLGQLGLKSTQKIVKMAVFARNETGSAGSIFIYNFALNGSVINSEITSTAGCLSY